MLHKIKLSAISSDKRLCHGCNLYKIPADEILKKNNTHIIH